MDSNPALFIQLIKNPIKFKFFLFSKLPSAFFSGLQVKDLDQASAAVTVPYRWFTQNPFHSTYFACLAMGAELSTGLLAQMYVYKKIPTVSMLVVQIESSFFKKATGLTTFICADGLKIEEAISRALLTGEGERVKIKSTGTNNAGELVAEFFISWSFKIKKNI